MKEKVFEDGGIASDEPYNFDLIDPGAMLAMAKVMWETAQTGRPNNWRKVPIDVHLNHLMIHVYKFMRGDKDEDHLARVMCRSFMSWSVNNSNHLSKEGIAGVARTGIQTGNLSGDVNSGPIYKKKEGVDDMYVVYLCAPLSGKIYGNVLRVKEAIRILREEYKTINPNKMPLILSPHVALYDITFGLEGENRIWGMECCMEMVKWCDEVIVIGSTITAGMAEEITLALSLGKKITRREDL